MMDSEFVCEYCDRSFSKKFGVTNHQRFCKEKPEEVDMSADAVEKKVEVKEEYIKSATERNQIKNLIGSRAATIRKTLRDVLNNGDMDQIKQKLLFEAGHMLSSKQIKELIEEKDKEIELEVQTHLPERTAAIQCELADHEEEWDRKDKAMKDEHRKAYSELLKKRKEAKDVIRKKQKDVEAAVKEEKAGHLIKERQDLEKRYASIRQDEMSIETKARQQVGMINQNKSQIDHIINDAENRAIEELVTTNNLTRTAAKELINLIPTVPEALEMINSADGMRTFMKRLCPSMALPAPDTKDVDVEAFRSEIKSEDDDEDEYKQRREDREMQRKQRNHEHLHDRVADDHYDPEY